MEPSPPKGARQTKKYSRPFYETSRKTSAEIVSEARSSLRTLETKRPFTPAETNRTLFGGKASQDGRPASVVSGLGLAYSDSRPGTGVRLSPLHSTGDDLKDIGKRLKSGMRSFSLDIPKEVNEVNNDDIEILDKRPSIVEKKKEANISVEGTLNNHEDPSFRTSLNYTDKKAINNVKADSENGLDEKRVNSAEKATYFKNYIKPLLGQMELNKLHEDMEALVVNFDILWKTLETGNLLGRSLLSTKQRSELLATVYKCTSGENVVLLLKLAKLFLSLEVTGKNLGAVCKLLLKVSRDKTHDDVFVTEGLLVLISSLLKSPQNLEAINLVYLTGTVKFLSMNPTMLDEMMNTDMLLGISLLLEHTLHECSNDVAKDKESCHMLVQVTASLVNFANVPKVEEKFLSFSILQRIIDLTESRYTDSDYFLNVSRLLSKLTMKREVCCEVVKRKDNLRILFQALKYNHKQPNITVRICYSLGNIANFCTDYRYTMTFDCAGIQLILSISNFYLDSMEEKGSDAKDVNDVLIKLIRIVANVSIEETCGRFLSNDDSCNRIFTRLFDLNERKTLSEDLLISCATTLNNLSYHASDSSALMHNQHTYVLGMIDMLLSSNVCCILEAMRVLGNFTRSKTARDIVANMEFFEIFINLLDSDNCDVVFSTCGVLINVMLDKDNHAKFNQFQGVSKLVRILRDTVETDWTLGGLICQLLWNFSEKMNTSVNCFGLDETDDLITVLNELMEPELALDYVGHEVMSESEREQLEESWANDFFPVASRLLRRIERHHTDLVPICTTSE